MLQISDDILDVYRIAMIPCPFGFSLDSEEGICHCDPLLSQNSLVTDCNINDQTILHPANSWISAHTLKNSHT